ncbi:putative RNA recognition motif domain, nucleotide-binding alpha-beta plait domain superfamily [Helianthus annuus]|nr:putative RNA recognition motif domain, nucleotide-binding alpha-beta plait domain superfamily [Helianthus annuus]
MHSLIESYGYLILRTVFALSKPRTHVYNPQPPLVNPYINTQIVKLENITKIPHLLFFRRSKELHRRWLLHMRVSTNASVLYQFSQAVNRKKLMMMMKNREVCEPFGDVVEVRMVRHNETNEGKGFAFMAFRSKNVAQKAIEELHNKDFKV